MKDWLGFHISADRCCELQGRRGWSEKKLEDQDVGDEKDVESRVGERGIDWLRSLARPLDGVHKHSRSDCPTDAVWRAWARVNVHSREIELLVDVVCLDSCCTSGGWH